MFGLQGSAWQETNAVRTRRRGGHASRIVAVFATMATVLAGSISVVAAQSPAPTPAISAPTASVLGHTRIQGGACTQSCHAAFAQCYKDTGSNRRVCEARLQQCLASCINKR